MEKKIWLYQHDNKEIYDLLKTTFQPQADNLDKIYPKMLANRIKTETFELVREGHNLILACLTPEKALEKYTNRVAKQVREICLQNKESGNPIYQEEIGPIEDFFPIAKACIQRVWYFGKGKAQDFDHFRAQKKSWREDDITPGQKKFLESLFKTRFYLVRDRKLDQITKKGEASDLISYLRNKITGHEYKHLVELIKQKSGKLGKEKSEKLLTKANEINRDEYPGLESYLQSL